MHGEFRSVASLIKVNGKYHVRVRIKGHKTVCSNFVYKADALKWSAETERSIRLGTFDDDEDKQDDKTLGELLQRYSEEISKNKKSCASERKRIRTLQKLDIALLKISEIDKNVFARFRDDRLKTVTPSTCLRDLSIFSHMINVANRDWGYNIPENPIVHISKPQANKSRNRRLEDGEESRLFSALAASENTWISPLVRFAIETAMRRGELLSLRWENVFISKRFVHLPDTKNGNSRDVPLSPTALSILESLHGASSAGVVFPVHFEGIKGLWKTVLKRADITDLRFHDLRHEATSRFFEKGLNVMEVAAITGHKDLRMLQRYTHLRAEDLALKLI
jgi:integrase